MIIPSIDVELELPPIAIPRRSIRSVSVGWKGDAAERVWRATWGNPAAGQMPEPVWIAIRKALQPLLRRLAVQAYEKGYVSDEDLRRIGEAMAEEIEKEVGKFPSVTHLTDALEIVYNE